MLAIARSSGKIRQIGEGAGAPKLSAKAKGKLRRKNKKAKRDKGRAQLHAKIAQFVLAGEPVPPTLLFKARMDAAARPIVIEPNPKPDTGHKRRKARKSFYASREWKLLRYETLRKHGATCQCCGAKATDGATMNVDHIQPISKAWHLRLDPDNLQVLCAWCNEGKLNVDSTDWRPAPESHGSERDIMALRMGIDWARENSD